MYWIWTNRRSHEDEIRIDGVPDYIQRNRLKFNLGNIQEKSLPIIEIEFENEDNDKLTDNLIAPGVHGLLVSEKICSIFKKLNVENVDYYDTKLVDTTNNIEYENYKIANIIGKIECINYGKSDIEFKRENKIRFINKLILDEEPLDTAGTKIVRLASFFPVIIVCDEIKSRCVEEGITGIKFYKPEEFSMP